MEYIKEERLKDFENLNNDYFVITDFDHTLTTPKSETSVGLIPHYIGGELFEKRTVIYNQYRPLELDYTLGKEEKAKVMKEWAQKSFKLLAEYITKESVDKAVETADIYLRKGAKEFLQEMNEKNIPVVVMSSGVGNIVKEFLRKEKCLFENMTITSNFFEFEDGKTKIDLDNIMATSNKEYKKIPEEIRNNLNTKSKALLFGDLIEDIKMMDEGKLQNTLTFAFLDENSDENLEKYRTCFDVVLTNESNFNDVNNIIKIK